MFSLIPLMSSFGELAAICFNVSKSCMGAGFYAYPQIFNLYGVLMTFGMTILSGIASILGIYVYINLNSKYKKGHSISTLGKIIVGKNFRYIADMVVILKCLAVGAGYLNQARTLIRKIPFEEYITYNKISNNLISYVLVMLGCAVFTPSILNLKLGKIKNLSYVGTFGIIVIIILSIIQAKDKEMNVEWRTENKNIFDDIGTFVFGFSCHQSIMAIHNETSIPERFLKLLILISVTFVACLYTLFGFINYAAFSVTSENEKRNLRHVFDAWDDNNTVRNLANALFAFVLVITVPFQLHPAKTYFVEMFNIKSSQNRSIVGISMILMCYFLTTQSWYSFEFVSKHLSKAFNSLLCFGFPVIFIMFNNEKKSLYSYLLIGYLGAFFVVCLASYFFTK